MSGNACIREGYAGRFWVLRPVVVRFQKVHFLAFGSWSSFYLVSFFVSKGEPNSNTIDYLFFCKFCLKMLILNLVPLTKKNFFFLLFHKKNQNKAEKYC